ncbi:MAG: histidine kinase [Eubacteriales bacterium]|nr:histidine kinase [Eubacteriales bacterium]
MRERQSKLQAKLFRAYLLLACVILFSFAIFFYFFVSRRLVKNEINALETLNSGLSQQVENALRDLDTVSVNINYTNMSKNILDDSFNLKISDDMLHSMSELFLTISGTDLMADQINLYDFSGNVLATGLTTLTRSATKEQLQLVDQAKALGGGKIITQPYHTEQYSKALRNKQWFISLYRSFNNQYGRPVGAIETVKRCKSIFKSIISYEKKQRGHAAKILVFDADGALVYPFLPEAAEKEELAPYYTATASLSTTESFDSPVSQKREYASRIVSKYSGYTYLAIQPRAYVLAPVSHLLRILIGVVAFLMLIASMISYRLSRMVVRPVKHLKHIIQRMEIDTLGLERATEYPVSVDELEELYQAFQHMSDKLKTSMNQLVEMKEQEAKSRFLALQTQMNPHFYYNSLSSIMILAENGQTEVIVKMARNLSMIMRYITGTSNISVPLREEIDYIQKYLYCMKVRYQSSLNYHIDIEESLLDIQIPKLLLQPIVENAIKYGTNCPPPWQITIHGFRSDTFWQIDVMDSGTGFSDDTLDKIHECIRLVEEHPGMPNMNIQGLGLLNVYLRWKLFCKKKMIFTYGNTEEGHGIFSIGEYFSNESLGDM